MSEGNFGFWGGWRLEYPNKQHNERVQDKQQQVMAEPNGKRREIYVLL